MKMVLSLYLIRGSSNFDETSCPDAHFGSKNGHVTKISTFSTKWQTSAILKIVFWLHLGYIYFRLTQNLICISKIMLRQGYMTKITNFVNSFWRTAAIMKMILSLYLSRGSSDFDEICCADARFNSENSHLTKNQNFAYSKWRTAAIWNIVIWLHLSELLSG